MLSPQQFARRAVPAPFLVLSLVFALAACNKGGGGDGHGGSGMGAMPPPEAGVVAVQPAEVPVTFEFVGQTVGSREVEVRGRVQGILERRVYTEGAFVQAGQVLFEIDRRPLEAQKAVAEAEVATAEARLAQARREAARLKPLVAERVASQKDYDDAASAEQIAAANLKAAQARLAEVQISLGYTTVTAPISGITGRGLKSEGSLVTPGGDSLLTTLVQVNPLHVAFGIAEADQARMDREIAAGTLVLPKGGFNVQLLGSDGAELAQGGRIKFRDSRVNAATGTVENRAELANPDGSLRAGQFVRVMLTGATRPNAFVVPQRAVVDGPGGKMVMIAAPGKDGAPVVQPRPIEVGEWVPAVNGGERSWVVRKGLTAGDQVIVDNLAKLRPGAPVKPVPPGAASAAPAAPAAAAKK